MKLFAFSDEASSGLPGQIAALRRNGLNGMEIRNVNGKNVSSLTLEEAGQIRRSLDDAGLSVWSVGSPIGKIDIVHDDFEAHVQTFLRTLEIAQVLGAENLRMFSFYLPQDREPSLFRQEVIDRLGRLLLLAQGSGVALFHENEKGIYGDIAPRCAELHAALPELAGVFDPANFVQCGQDTLQAWEMLFRHVKYLHIKDALPDGTVVPAGQGAGHVPEIIRRFIARGGVAMTLEPHLRIFDGLSALEQETHRSQVGTAVYETADAAFDAAADALKSLL